MIHTNFISIDPGSEGTGVAFFADSSIPYSVLNLSSKHETWEKRCDEICYKFEGYILPQLGDDPIIEKVFCEQPAFFEGSFAGITAARSDSLVKLTILFGRFWQITASKGIDFIPVKIRDWKGHLNKQQTANRVAKITCQTYKTTHETDAVGIGLFIKKLF